VNAALFMLTSAFVAGADPAPAAPAPAPAIVSTGSSCGGGCATVCDSGCGHKPGLWSRLKARFSKHSSCGCEAAPACKAEPVCKKEPIFHCKPTPVCKAEPVCKAAPAPTCGGCATACDSGCGHVGLWSRIKGKFGKHGSASCDTCDGGCAPAAVAAPADPVPAKDPPKKEMPKDLPKGGVTNLNLEPIVTPVSTPKPAIQVSPNPF